MVAFGAPDIYDVALGVVLLMLLANGVLTLRDRLRHSREPAQLRNDRSEASVASSTAEREWRFLRRNWMTATVVVLAAILLLIHLPHAVYIAGVLLLAAVVWPARLRTWRSAWRRDPTDDD
jgi:hypothetical protein